MKLLIGKLPLAEARAKVLSVFSHIPLVEDPELSLKIFAILREPLTKEDNSQVNDVYAKVISRLVCFNDQEFTTKSKSILDAIMVKLNKSGLPLASCWLNSMALIAFPTAMMHHDIDDKSNTAIDVFGPVCLEMLTKLAKIDVNYTGTVIEIVQLFLISRYSEKLSQNIQKYVFKILTSEKFYRHVLTAEQSKWYSLGILSIVTDMGCNVDFSFIMKSLVYIAMKSGGQQTPAIACKTLARCLQLSNMSQNLVRGIVSEITVYLNQVIS